MKKNAILLGKLLAIICVTAAATYITSNKCSTYQMSVINNCLIYYLCVASINIMLGLVGYLNFATVPLMGLSAFITANLAIGGMPALLAILAGMLITGVVATILGFLLLRLKGPYFVFGTMGLVYIGTVVYNNYVPFSGGPNGRYNIPHLNLFGYEISNLKMWFPILLILAFATIWFVYRIKNTALGRSLMAIRDDETAACTLGINVYRSKIIAFAICGLMAGLAGGILAIHNGVVSASLFKMSIAQEFVIMAMLGGILSPIGSFVGTFLVGWLPEWLRFSASLMNIIYGIAIILLMIFMPMGLSSIVVGQYKKIKKLIKGGKKKRVVSEC